MSYSELLNPKEVLARVREYEVLRDDQRSITIEVLEVIAGGAKARFVAQAFLGIRASAKNEWMGKGATEDEALRNCLAKIKTVPTAEFYEATRQPVPQLPALEKNP